MRSERPSCIGSKRLLSSTYDYTADKEIALLVNKLTRTCTSIDLVIASSSKVKEGVRSNDSQSGEASAAIKR